jgi:hypothetical protein
MPIHPLKRPSADQVAISIIALIEAARKEQGEALDGFGEDTRVTAYQAVVEYLTQSVTAQLQEDAVKLSLGERVHIRRRGALYREATVVEYAETPDETAPKHDPAKKFRAVLEGDC